MFNVLRNQILLISFLLLMVGSGFVLADVQHDHASEVNGSQNQFTRPEKKILLISDEKILPEQIVLKKLDGSVFFLNATKSSLLTFQIDFGEHRPHCASANLRYDKKRKALHSIEPVGPKDFALLCFPEKGTYSATINGLDKGQRVSTVQIVVR